MSGEPLEVPNTLDLATEARIWKHRVPGRLLPRLFLQKLWAKYFDRRMHPYRLQPAIHVDGLVIFDFADPVLFGGGTVQGPDFLRALVELRLAPVTSLCDFCSGTGYIGYSLLARRFCKTLCCVDRDAPSIEGVNLTARFNGITDRVTAYVSDGLEAVPATEKWDLVIGNVPRLLPCGPEDTDTVFEFDPGWQLHRKFYSRLKQHMVPGGHTVIMETRHASTTKTFEAMILSGGGRIIAEVPARDFCGREDDRYFVVSQW